VSCLINEFFPLKYSLLLISEALNVLYRDNWTQLASQEIIKMQTELFHSIRQQVITSGGSRSYRALPQYQAAGHHFRWVKLMLHFKKRIAIFPSPAGMSHTKLSLGRNNLSMTS
jgi:hypothetical protein